MADGTSIHRRASLRRHAHGDVRPVAMPGSDWSPRSEDPPDDVELLHRMRDGDVSSLELLYTRFAALTFTLALRIVGDPELAREALQDTFLRCWDGRETYDPARGRVPWWLMGIARNRAIDLLRSRPHQARLREQDSRLLPMPSRYAARSPMRSTR